jgi:PadR family transcriptional regulator, regulatory protein PadR
LTYLTPKGIHLAMSKTPANFLNGLPELLVLQLLSHHEMYGYEIVRAIREKSGEAFDFGEGCIYPYLHHLEKSKCVRSKRMLKEGRTRVYYKLTEKGLRRLRALDQEWQRVAAGVTTILKGAHA